jgi:hypothetical protein
MFSFCAVMTDVNHAPLNGPPSPLLTSGISNSLIPILREPGMDVSISAGSPQGCLDTGLSDMESACWKTSAPPIQHVNLKCKSLKYHGIFKPRPLCNSCLPLKCLWSSVEPILSRKAARTETSQGYQSMKLKRNLHNNNLKVM